MGRLGMPRVQERLMVRSRARKRGREKAWGGDVVSTERGGRAYDISKLLALGRN
jgi:hypothetical protein